MPKKCIHLEKLQDMFGNSRIYKNWHSGDLTVSTYDCLFYYNGSGIDHIDSQNELHSDPIPLWIAEVLDRTRKIVSECNCGNEIEQQLILARNTETSLIRVQERSEGLERENSRLGELIKAGERALNKKDEQIARRDEQIREKEGQLTLSEAEVRRITGLFNDLQIENNNKNNQINQKTEELRKKESEIIDLKAQLGTLSPEEVLNRKISLKRRELDGFINNLSLNYETVMNLCDAYERLDLARRNYNQNDITNARNDIRRLEGELCVFATQNNITVDDLHDKIYQNCEGLAKLRAELEKLHEQQYQAQQEVPPHNCNQQ